MLNVYGFSDASQARMEGAESLSQAETIASGFVNDGLFVRVYERLRRPNGDTYERLVRLRPQLRLVA